jgi:Tol biopolymer transport system component
VIRRLLLAVVLTGLMVVSGAGSYLYLGAHQSKIALAPEKPTAATPRAQAVVLPGTLYLSQEGALYSLSTGKFHQLTAEDGWTQPALSPDGTTLIAVRRTVWYADVYYLSRYGAILRHVVSNNVPGPHPASAAYHWSFYPRMSPTGSTLWMSYDKPKFGYDVVMSIWNMPANGTIGQGHLWSNANDYSGGDIQPLPLRSGGVIYTKYSYYNQHLVGQLWLSTRPEVGYLTGTALTTPDQDCAEPALSPDGHYMAMICTYNKQISQLTIATWNGRKLGPLQTIIANQLVAEPAWAPDGSGIAYFAPGSPDGPFQLWWLPRAAYFPPAPIPVPTPPQVPGGPHNGPLPSPTPVVIPPPPPVRPIQLTTDLGFDATSPIAWAP